MVCWEAKKESKVFPPHVRILIVQRKRVKLQSKKMWTLFLRPEAVVSPSLLLMSVTMARRKAEVYVASNTFRFASFAPSGLQDSYFFQYSRQRVDHTVVVVPVESGGLFFSRDFTNYLPSPFFYLAFNKQKLGPTPPNAPSRGSTHWAWSCGRASMIKPFVVRCLSLMVSK